MKLMRICPRLPSLVLIFCILPLHPATANQELAAVPKESTATQLITHFIDNYHYKPTQLDDRLSEAMLQRYLESLDPNHSYFLASDIDSFNQYKDRLDDALRSAQLAPGFDIFRVFQKRLRQRIDYADSLLDKDFDFDVDERYRFDRSDAPWAKDKAALNEIWRKRIKNDVLSLKLADKPQDEIADTLRKRYQALAKRNAQVTPGDVYQLFINAYTGSVEPHTAYFSPRTSENFEIRMSLSLEGIGALLSTDGEYTVIQRLVPGGPAQEGGLLHADDHIVGVGQDKDGEIVDVVGWRLDDVVDLIRGPKDSVVQLRIVPYTAGQEGPSKTIAVTRGEVQLDKQAAHKSIIKVDADQDHGSRSIGVIDIPTFYLDYGAMQRGDKDYRSTTRDVRRLLGELKQAKVDGIIIDLRGNGGGPLTEATQLTGLFLDQGPVVQVKDSTGNVEIERDSDPGVAYSGPLAVLVDSHSASASEIFAGAIQDYNRGIIVGEPTYGKGTVQQLVDLDRFNRDSDKHLGQLKATIAQFFRVSGSSTQHRGVTPDIKFSTVIESSDEGESGLENALPWQSIKPAEFQPARGKYRHLDQVRQRHTQRIKHNKAFQIVLAQAQAEHEAEAKHSVTLLAAKRRKQQDKIERQNRERTNRLRELYGLAPIQAEDDKATTDTAQSTEPAEQDDDDIHVLLDETAYILADLASLDGRDGQASPPAPAADNDPLSAANESE